MTTSTTQPVHLQPTSCHVCGWPESDHSLDSVWGKLTARDGHKFWSNADAEAYFDAESKRLGDGPLPKWAQAYQS